MQRIKRLTAIMLLALVASVGAPQAFGGVAESPGKTVTASGVAESPGVTLESQGAAESPGITAIILDLLAAML